MDLSHIHHAHARMRGFPSRPHSPDAPSSRSYKRCRGASKLEEIGGRPQHQHHLRFSPSLLSDGHPNCSPTNSSAESDDGHLTINDNGNAARTDTTSHQPYHSKSAGLGEDTTAENHIEGFRSILAGSRSPFTASQWQELEYQALIFKYIMAGVRVPSDLVIPIRETVAALSFALSYQPRMTRSYFQLGFGSSNADPEPGRCRRTDGKKWRCSRDVVPDQKYCERHMHRGRNRSRKPMEAAPSYSDAAPSSSIININARTTSSSSCSSPFTTNPPNHNINHQEQCQSSSLLSSNVLLQISSASASTMASNKEYRCMNGMAGEVSQDSVLSSVNNNGWRSNMPSKLLQIKREENGPSVQGNSTQIRTLLVSHDLGAMSGTNQTQTQHSWSNPDLGVVEYCNGVSEGHGQPLRHFFDDWPRSRNTSDVEEDRSNRCPSTTHLSISIPMASSNSSSHRVKEEVVE